MMKIDGEPNELDDWKGTTSHQLIQFDIIAALPSQKFWNSSLMMENNSKFFSIQAQVETRSSERDRILRDDFTM